MDRADNRGPVWTGQVPADWPAKTAAPVAVPLPHGWSGPEVLNATVQVEGRPGRCVPAQCEPRSPTGRRRAWFLVRVKPEDRGRRVTVNLHPADTPAGPQFVANYDGQALHVVGKDASPYLSYMHGPPADGLPYPFTDYIHPLFGVDGEELTEAAPEDHPHHRGLFWAWVRQSKGNQPLGGWWLPKAIRCEPGPLVFQTGPVFALWHGRHWLIHDPEQGEGVGRFLCNEVIGRVYWDTDGGRILDVELAVRALVDEVKIGGRTTSNKGYGGLTFRYGPAREVRIEADGERMEKDAIGHRARWADWSGFFEGPDGQELDHRSGAAVLVAPSHPDYPPKWLLRHYGVLNVSYPGVEMCAVPKDQPMVLRYRVWIHRGDAEAGQVEAQYRVYTADWHWKSASGSVGMARDSVSDRISTQRGAGADSQPG